MTVQSALARIFKSFKNSTSDQIDPYSNRTILIWTQILGSGLIEPPPTLLRCLTRLLTKWKPWSALFHFDQTVFYGFSLYLSWILFAEFFIYIILKKNQNILNYWNFKKYHDLQVNVRFHPWGTVRAADWFGDILKPKYIYCSTFWVFGRLPNQSTVLQKWSHRLTWKPWYFSKSL